MKREIVILLSVKCETANLFPVKRDEDPPSLTTLSIAMHNSKSTRSSYIRFFFLFEVKCLLRGNLKIQYILHEEIDF